MAAVTQIHTFFWLHSSMQCLHWLIKGLCSPQALSFVPFILGSKLVTKGGSTSENNCSNQLLTNDEASRKIRPKSFQHCSLCSWRFLLTRGGQGRGAMSCSCMRPCPPRTCFLFSFFHRVPPKPPASQPTSEFSSLWLRVCPSLYHPQLSLCFSLLVTMCFLTFILVRNFSLKFLLK